MKTVKFREMPRKKRNSAVNAAVNSAAQIAAETQIPRYSAVRGKLWALLISQSHNHSATQSVSQSRNQCVRIFVLLHKATPIDKPQLSYMVNKLYKTLSYRPYKTLNEGIRKCEG